MIDHNNVICSKRVLPQLTLKSGTLLWLWARCCTRKSGKCCFLSATTNTWAGRKGQNVLPLRWNLYWRGAVMLASGLRQALWVAEANPIQPSTTDAAVPLEHGCILLWWWGKSQTPPQGKEMLVPLPWGSELENWIGLTQRSIFLNQEITLLRLPKTYKERHNTM